MFTAFSLNPARGSAIAYLFLGKLLVMGGHVYTGDSPDVTDQVEVIDLETGASEEGFVSKKNYTNHHDYENDNTENRHN